MPEQIPLTERPEVLDSVPKLRYWGDRKPPKNRADMFSTTVRAAAEGDTSTADSSTSTKGNVATMRMYGPIDSWGGFWGISARDVSEALDGLGTDVTEIRVRINSPGGEAWEGMAILNMLRAHPAKVIAVVDGIAASAASFIATGVEETVMSPGTQMMIHDASGFAFGPAAIMRKSAESLDSISNSIASIYAESAGGSVEDWRAVMVEETWYTAQEAADAHLADRVAVVPDVGQTTTASSEDTPTIDGDPFEDRFDLSIYNYAGRSHAPAPKPPAASADGSTPTNVRSSAVAFNDEQMTNMRRTLGVAEDADEATILAALDESLAERAEPEAADIPEGHVVIPAAKLADLEAGAALATSTAKTLHERERKTFLDSVRDKFLPTSRSGWEAEYDRDSAGVRAHFESAPQLIPTSELGAGDGDPDATSGDVAYDSLYDEKKEA